MSTMTDTEATVRDLSRRAGIRVVKATLPHNAVCAVAPSPDARAWFLVIDTSKPHAWAHAEQMILSSADVFSAGGRPTAGILA